MFGRNLVVATAVNANPVLIFSSSLSWVARQKKPDCNAAGATARAEEEEEGQEEEGARASGSMASPTCYPRHQGLPVTPRHPSAVFAGLRRPYSQTSRG